jgi:hypothetical protein
MNMAVLESEKLAKTGLHYGLPGKELLNVFPLLTFAVSFSTETDMEFE